jgi:hypothetical protein
LASKKIKVAILSFTPGVWEGAADRGEHREAAGSARFKARDEASQGEKMQKWEYNLLVQSPNTECARCEEAIERARELVTFYVNSAGDNVFVLKKPKEQ